MSNYSKGARYERELVNELRNDGWFAMRLAASGGGTDAELPDVLAAKDEQIVVIELKFTSSSRITVKRSKVDGLRWLANHLGASALIGGRFSGDTDYYFWTPSECKQNAKSISAGKADRKNAMRLL